MKFAQCHMTCYGSRTGVLKTTPQNPTGKGAHQHDIHVIKDSCCAEIPWFSLHSLKKWRWKSATVVGASGFPRWLGGNKSACHCSRHRRCSFNPWVGRIPLSRKWQPTQVFLPGKSHGQWSLEGYSPWGQKESDMTEHACWCNCAVLL